MTAALHLRAARPSDKPDALELTKTIWEGEDYVPHVWDDWLADPHGQLSVAEIDGRVVGLGKLTRLAPGEWWLEGLRVDPRWQGQGIGRAVHEYHIELWRKMGDSGALRLFTHRDNHAVHKMCERTGFERVLELTKFKAAAVAGPHDLAPVEPAEVEGAFEIVSRAPLYAAQRQMCNLDRQFGLLTPERLTAAVAAGNAYRWRGRAGVLLVFERMYAADDPEEAQRLFIQFPAAPNESLPDMLRDVCRLAAARGKPEVRCLAPVLPAVMQAYGAAGYERAWDDSMYLFEARS